MKTYLTVMFHSEGSNPSEVKSQLMNMGFEAAQGSYDFVYDWGCEEASVNDLVMFADRVHTSLKGHRVLFSIETI